MRPARLSGGSVKYFRRDLSLKLETPPDVLRTLLSLASGLLGVAAVLAQAPQITLDHADGAYAPGETIRLTVTGGGSGTIEYDVSYTPVAGILQTGRAELRGGVAEVTYATDVPSFLFFRVRLNGQQTTATAVVGRDEIGALAAAPDDFDAFWARQRAALANVPLDLRRARISETAYTTSYSFSAASVDGRRVYGYYVVPKGSGPKPAALLLPPYGDQPNIVSPAEQAAERGNLISVSIGIHDAPPGQVDPKAYDPNDLRDPETIYYRYAVLAAVRAIDVLATLPEWDREHVLAYGRSQGGGLAMLTAAADTRVTHVYHSVSALGQHAGRLVDQASGFPRYIKRAEDVYAAAGDEAGFASATQAVQYYDIVHAAARLEIPVMYFVNYRDEVCPPATHYAAFNVGRGPRVALHSLDLAHASAPEYEDHFLPFARLHFPATRTPPWPYPLTEQAFAVDAGADQRLAGLQARLEGLATYDGQDLSAAGEVEWELMEGPGTVDFSQARGITTDAAFSQPGTYRLRLRVRSAHPTDARKYYLLTDEVRVEVGSRNPLPATLTHFSASLRPQPTTLAWETASEEDVSHFTVERSGDGRYWSAIGHVDAVGYSTVPRAYEYWDAAPPAGLSYYRLAIVDEDGTQEASEAVSVTVDAGADFLLAPNPAASTVCLSGVSTGEQLRIVDPLGRVVRAQALEAPCLDVSDLASGVYVVGVGRRAARLVVE